MGEIDYRLIAVRSSSLDSRKEKSIMKRVEKARAAIAKVSLPTVIDSMLRRSG